MDTQTICSKRNFGEEMYKLEIVDSNSPTWKFEDEYSNYEDLTIRVNEKLKTWKEEMKVFSIKITRSQ